MESTNAIVTLDGISTQVSLSADGSIIDGSGHTFTLPGDVHIDPATMNLVRGSKVVGKISEAGLSPNNEDNTTTPGASSGNGSTNRTGATNASSSGNTATATAAATTAAASVTAPTT